jgi:trimeric autotransporter adhesin
MRALSVTMGRKSTAGVLSLLLFAGAFAGLGSTAARADSAPVEVTPGNPTTVSADALPTVQINGVAWAQVVVGNTVYVAGKFSSARPAGAPAGTNETPRNNILAYDIRTGVLNTSFAPSLNGQALAIAASPDGSRIYVGGDFNTANGVSRHRIAAFDAVTGALITTFRPAAGGQVRAITATSSTVYLGGLFTSIGGIGRTRMAAVNASDGALLPWAPVPGVGPTDGNDLPPEQGQTTNPKNDLTSNEVMAMLAVGDGAQIVVAGRFDTLNGVKATGIGALDPVTGETRPFAVNQLVTNQGVNSAIYSLSADGPNVSASGYDFYGPGNVEGAFVADAMSGELVWMGDCHGDTYSTVARHGALYVAGHPHVCSNIGGFLEREPRVSQFAIAYSMAATGTVGSATIANDRFTGKPAPSVLNWYPTFYTGTFTNQGQAGWTVAATDEYVVYGGEFPGVNGLTNQGLVRFAVPTIAPNKIGPNANDQLTPTVRSLSAGTARVSWQTTFDRDNTNLTYRVYRSDKGNTPVFEQAVQSTFYDRPSMGFVDKGLTPGATYGYRVAVSDPFGNTVTRGTTTVTVSASPSRQ